MTEIELNIENEGTTSKIKCRVHSCWEELTKSSLIEISELYFNQSLSKEEAQVHALLTLSTLEKKQYLRLLGEEIINVKESSNLDVLLSLSDTTGWLFEQVQFSKSIIPNYLILKGPKDFLENVTWEQIGYADFYYSKFQNPTEGFTKDQCIIGLVASLYTPFGMSYGKLSSQLTRLLAKLLPNKVLLAMLLNYLGLRTELFNLYQSVFDSDSEPSKEVDPRGFQKLAYSIAGEKVGSMHQVLKLPVNDVFLILEKMKEDADEIRKRK